MNFGLRFLPSTILRDMCQYLAYSSAKSARNSIVCSSSPRRRYSGGRPVRKTTSCNPGRNWIDPLPRLSGSCTCVSKRKTAPNVPPRVTVWPTTGNFRLTAILEPVPPHKRPTPQAIIHFPQRSCEFAILQATAVIIRRVPTPIVVRNTSLSGVLAGLEPISLGCASLARAKEGLFP